jgi:hypothetical protein
MCTKKLTLLDEASDDDVEGSDDEVEVDDDIGMMRLTIALRKMSRIVMRLSMATTTRWMMKRTKWSRKWGRVGNWTALLCQRRRRQSCQTELVKYEVVVRPFC